jgi:hypothetical protein
MDGEEFESFIIADYIVRKGSKTYVVEVKSQEIASRIYEPSVRRQLLEYFLTFKPDGVLLVDMSGKKIHRVEFIRAKDRSYLWLIFTIFILILIICLLILRN